MWPIQCPYNAKEISHKLNSFEELTVTGTDIKKEAAIVKAFESSVAYGMSASNLLDGKGLNGKNNEGFCSHTISGAHANNWYSLELAAPQKISSVQITPRLDCCSERQQNVRITIGPSKAYDPNEPLCLPEIPQLTLEEGLTTYECTKPLHEGKYIKISREDSSLNICEVKVFTATSANAGPPPAPTTTTPGAHKLAY